MILDRKVRWDWVGRKGKERKEKKRKEKKWNERVRVGAYFNLPEPILFVVRENYPNLLP